MSKKTVWFPAEKINPVHEGLYECFVFYSRSHSFKTFFIWDGNEWRTHDGYATPFGVSGDKWRGLAAPK